MHAMFTGMWPTGAHTLRSHQALHRARKFHAGIWESGMGGGEPSAGMLSMLMAAADEAATAKL